MVAKISMQGVSKRFGEKVILDNFNLDIEVGESVVVIGGSGVGKSVMLKCILGLLTPEEGSIKISGEEIVGISTSERDRINDKMGMLFQYAALFDSQRIWENVTFGLMSTGAVSRRDARDVAITKMALVGLGPEIADRYPAELSSGMRKRVGLARAIASQPEIIFFDEPTTGLDPIMGDIINDLIVHCVQETGATTLTITHDMQSARKIADRIAMIFQGRIIWIGPTDEIETSGNEYVSQFIEGRTDGPIQMAVRS
ncbi:MAG: ATP-binding cassette domain-containing protein [Rhodospirillaceae bacterium]|jgi:phospholipid/cholesterol/gamma-HCH transport system ATP-binding protein